MHHEKIAETVNFVNEMGEKEYKRNGFTHAIIINTLCKVGETGLVIDLLKKIEDTNFIFDTTSYNIIINIFCKDGLVTDTLDIFFTIKSKSIHPDI